MRALVVVESSFGNSRAVAEALAEGLSAELGDADVRSVGNAPTELAPAREWGAGVARDARAGAARRSPS